jgi:hypothetical protein
VFGACMAVLCVLTVEIFCGVISYEFSVGICTCYYVIMFSVSKLTTENFLILMSVPQYSVHAVEF